MNKHNIKEGDTVRIIGDSNGHYFKIGQLVTVDKICNEGCENEYLKCSDKEESFYVIYKDIEPVTPEHTFDGWAMFNQKGELCKHTISTTELEAKGGLINDWKALSERGCTIKPVSVTVKIKQDGKED
jgi:hypothetical protein